MRRPAAHQRRATTARPAPDDGGGGRPTRPRLREPPGSLGGCPRRKPRRAFARRASRRDEVPAQSASGLRARPVTWWRRVRDPPPNPRLVRPGRTREGLATEKCSDRSMVCVTHRRDGGHMPSRSHPFVRHAAIALLLLGAAVAVAADALGTAWAFVILAIAVVMVPGSALDARRRRLARTPQIRRRRPTTRHEGRRRASRRNLRRAPSRACAPPDSGRRHPRMPP